MPSTNNVFIDIETKPLPQIPHGALHPSVIKTGSGNEVFYANRRGFVVDSQTSTATIAGFDNGEQIVNQVSIENVSGRNVIAIVERALYVGSVAGANLLPGGSSIDESQFQIIGGNFSLLKYSQEEVGPYELANHQYIRNISAGTISLIIQVRVRYIVGGAGFNI